MDTAQITALPKELENSLFKIIEYSNVSSDIKDKFISKMDEFIKAIKSKLIETRKLRREIETLFWKVYENVLKRVVDEDNNDKLYNMFLNYGYLDERLLTLKQIVQLYSIEYNTDKDSLCNIYTMRQWLEAIYKGDREPSVNSFDMDYYDDFRELKRKGELTDKDKETYSKDRDRKLNFEIMNIVAENQRLCCAQGSVYFPALYDEMIVGDINRACITPEIINSNIKKILDVDFSLFHREIFCHDDKRNLNKEYIMKQVFPDIILVPTFGLKSLMWQPISDRDRSKPARFMVPIFTGENIENMLIKICGAYRWEFCKSNMGVDWADITHKSLTSEYSDYIQFYRKNNDLSAEAKQKIRNQILRFRNMLRDIFSYDYELWVKYESTGAIRLNKLVRKIMYQYCPFPKPIRTNLEKQIAFSEAANMYNRELSKKVKTLENKINKLSKTKIGVPEELEENLNFYKNS